MRPATRALLSRVAALYPCIVISGRALPDVTERVKGLGLRGVVGNHGVEPWRATKQEERVLRVLVVRLPVGPSELVAVDRACDRSDDLVTA